MWTGAGEVLERQGFQRGVPVKPGQQAIVGHGVASTLGSFPLREGQSVTLRVADNGVMAVGRMRLISRTSPNLQSCL